MAADYTTDLNTIIDYSEDNLSGKNNIYARISKIDKNLSNYLKSVRERITNEKSYGALNYDSIPNSIAKEIMVDVNYLITNSTALSTRWEYIKKEIKRAALTERVKILTEVKSSCLKFNVIWQGRTIITREERKTYNQVAEELRKAEIMLKDAKKRLQYIS